VVSGLQEAGDAKPDLDAELNEVDFTDDFMSSEIEEKNGDSSTAEAEKNTLQKEQTKSDTDANTAEKDQESLDFSDELESLSFDEPVVSDDAVVSENTEE